MRLLQEDWAEQEQVPHFVTTSECAICRNFVNSCCKGCERARLKKSLDHNAAKQEPNASFQDFEVTFELTPKGTQLGKASDKVRTPRWVLVLKERSKTRSTMHLGVLRGVGEWRPKAADERMHRHGKQEFRGTCRDDTHGKPMGTMNAGYVGSTKLIKTSEVGNSNSNFRKKKKAIERYMFSWLG